MPNANISEHIGYRMHFSEIQKLVIWAIPVLFAITVHEVAHGLVASWCGDKTASKLGRLTLNPLKHIDLLGTVIVPLALFFLGGFIFGWAKPVPVDARNMKSPRRDMALVALAGPFANLIMAVIWAIIAKMALMFQTDSTWVAAILVSMGLSGILINLVLAVLNLIPIPPLDGSRVISSIIPQHMAYQYNKFERYGFIILLILLVTGILGKILWPMVGMLFALLAHGFNLPL
jgi:Zn-dependent protease